MAYSAELWAEAKKKCRLNRDEIALAKRLGLNPRSLIKNIPNKSELWKAPVKEWISDIDEKRQKKSEQKKRMKEIAAKEQAAKEISQKEKTEKGAKPAETKPPGLEKD